MNAATEVAPQPSDAEIKAALLAPPPAVPPCTYELALVMGGTVSSGAYTAGAVDFLIEALDCFAAEKTASAAKYHDVVLKVLCGTSGGAVTAAITARALNYPFPPQSAPAATDLNPLYHIWVKALDLAPMLKTSDIGTSVPSLLNVQPIDDGIGYVIGYTATPPAGFRRDWVGGPVTLIVTHTNLSGIPYDLDFGGGQSQRFITHLDHAHYAVSYAWQNAPPAPKPYEYSLNFAGTAAAQWDTLGQYAVASAAFPLGFTTRRIDRPLNHYFYRAVCTAMPPQSAADVHVLRPDIEAILNTNASTTPGNVRYSTVDGGVIDNEPIELARVALAGITGILPSGSAAANRSIWLIDPFAGQTDLAGFNMSDIALAAGATLNAALQQTRYSTADLVLALQPENYSRYMLSATRDGLSGSQALATAGLGAFMGFACEAFRAHDFHLGRQNCRQFLLTQFRQSAQNPVFAAWTPAQKTRFIDADGDLPIIPLFGSAQQEQAVPEWPVGACDPTTLKDAVKSRLEAILVKELFPNNLAGRIFGAVAAEIPADIAADYVVNALASSLKAWGLAKEA